MQSQNRKFADLGFEQNFDSKYFYEGVSWDPKTQVQTIQIDYGESKYSGIGLQWPKQMVPNFLLFVFFRTSEVDHQYSLTITIYKVILKHVQYIIQIRRNTKGDGLEVVWCWDIVTLPSGLASKCDFCGFFQIGQKLWPLSKMLGYLNRTWLLLILELSIDCAKF